LDLPLKTAADTVSKLLGLLGKVPYVGEVLLGLKEGLDAAVLAAEYAGIEIDPARYSDFGDPQIQRWGNIGFFDNYYQTNAGLDVHTHPGRSGDRRGRRQPEPDRPDRLHAGRRHRQHHDLAGAPFQDGFQWRVGWGGPNDRVLAWYAGTVDLA